MLHSLFSRSLRAARPTQLNGLGRRHFASDGSRRGVLYNTFFKTNSRYVLFVFSGAIIGEAIHELVFDTLWNVSNRGKLYKDIDWSKWNSLYLEEDEE